MFINQKDRTTLIQVLTLYLVSDSGDNLIEDDIRTDAEEFLTKLKGCQELLDQSDPRKVERDFDEDEEDFQDELDESDEEEDNDLGDDEDCECDNCSCRKAKAGDIVKEPQVDWASLYSDVVKLPMACVQCIDTTLPLLRGTSLLKEGNRYSINFVNSKSDLIGVDLMYTRVGKKKNGKNYITQTVQNISSITFHDNNEFTICGGDDDELDFSFVLDNHEDTVAVEKWDEEFGEVPVNETITFSLL